MSKLTLQGTIKVIYDTQTFDSGFQKREFVLTTNDTYPQDVKLEVVKDKCTLLDTYAVGSSVEVAFNVRGNEYNGKYYVNLQAWGINNAGVTEDNSKPLSINHNTGEVVDSDLPF